MTKKQANNLRRPCDRTVKVLKHDQFCLYSDGAIIPPYPCTCGATKYTYHNVLKGA